MKGVKENRRGAEAQGKIFNRFFAAPAVQQYSKSSHLCASAVKMF